MADIDKVVEIVQLKIQNTETSFVSTIENTIEIIWGNMAQSGELWFLRANTPFTINLVVDIDEYETLEEERIGKILHIANSVGKQIYEYKSRTQFDRARNASNFIDTELQNPDDFIGIATIFTDVGTTNGKRVIKLNRKPAQSSTSFLHYQEAGVLANLNKLPLAWVKVLIHGCMSLLSPPQEIGKLRWQSLTSGEDQLYAFHLDRMLRLEKGGEDERREHILDQQVDWRMQEINNL